MTALRLLVREVHGTEFRAIHQDYFQRFCEEFDDAEENKLAYTTIHNESLRSRSSSRGPYPTLRSRIHRERHPTRIPAYLRVR